MGFFDKFIKKEKQYIFEINDEGIHQLGGVCPEDFIMPKNNFISNIQYLGVIRNIDSIFNWLPFELHLICPILLDFDYIYVDYSNPLKPNILFPENTAEITSAYDNLTSESILEFKKVNVNAVESELAATYLEDGIGNCVKPNWEQHSKIPKSPKNNKKMKFVCQLISTNKVQTYNSNIFRTDDNDSWLITEFDFWCDGSLYIYFDVESKIGCYFIQNT